MAACGCNRNDGRLEGSWGLVSGQHDDQNEALMGGAPPPVTDRAPAPRHVPWFVWAALAAIAFLLLRRST